MPSFSSLVTSLTGAGFYYEKSSRHATYTFNQDSQSLYRNQPRLPFEYYVAINLNNVSTAKAYISKYFNSSELTQIPPLVKSIDMPSIKIETNTLNQYNRKRISQPKIVMFEPVKMVFHDVVDGKTLKFWEMYYRYYFGDGTEPGKNDAKQSQSSNKPYTLETLVKNLTPSLNPSITNLPSSVKSLFNSKNPTGKNSSRNTNGNKESTQNIVQNTLDNQIFGFNLPVVQNIRNLIQNIQIFQVHGGRFNQVTLVNPRISAFTHDVLNYGSSEKTLELTFTIEYEYAYYNIQNLKLGGTESNNSSSLDPFKHGDFLELPSLAFTATLNDFIESNNPLLQSDNPILQGIGKNVQNTIGSVTGAALSNAVRRVDSSVLNGLSNINPKPYYSTAPAQIQVRPLASTATPNTTQYKDVNRIGGNGG
jgi:hypothetical protein